MNSKEEIEKALLESGGLEKILEGRKLEAAKARTTGDRLIEFVIEGQTLLDNHGESLPAKDISEEVIKEIPRVMTLSEFTDYLDEKMGNNRPPVLFGTNSIIYRCDYCR